MIDEQRDTICRERERERERETWKEIVKVIKRKRQREGWSSGIYYPSVDRHGSRSVNLSHLVCSEFDLGD